MKNKVISPMARAAIKSEKQSAFAGFLRACAGGVRRAPRQRTLFGVNALCFCARPRG
jgi:hypothetical protein